MAFTRFLKLEIPAAADDVTRSNLNKIDTLAASGLYDDSGNLILRSDQDVVLRPGNGFAGSFRFTHQLDTVELSTKQFSFSNDTTFTGAWQIPWANIDTSEAEFTDFPNFEANVASTAVVTLNSQHRIANNNPHGVTAAQVGAATPATVTAAVSAHSLVSSNVHGVSGSLVGTFDTQNLTNKTISADTNTITNLQDSNFKAGTKLPGSRINPDFANQRIKTSLDLAFAEGGYNTVLRAAQSGLSQNLTFSLPNTLGNNGQFLSTNGSGDLVWATSAASTFLTANAVRIGNTSNEQQNVDTSSQGDVLASVSAGLTLKDNTVTVDKLVDDLPVSILEDLTPSRALVSDVSGNLFVSPVSSTELAFLQGTTSNIQTQLGSKENDLGNPATSGFVLSSTDTGTRSWVDPSSFGFADPTTTQGDLIYNDGTNTTRLPLGTASQVLTSDGTNLSYSLLTNDNLDTNADVALTKLASLTANRAIVSNTLGKLVPSPTTNTELAFLQGTTSNVQDQLNAINVARSLKETWTLAEGNSKTVTHNFGTVDVLVQVFDVSTGETVVVDSSRTDNNSVTFSVDTVRDNDTRILIQEIL